MTDHIPSINVNKVNLLCHSMRSKGIKAALITQTHNYSWVTDGGRSWIGLATENATAVQLLIIDSEPAKVIALTNSIEAERVKAEEGACFKGDGLQLVVVEIPWHDPAAGSKRQQAIDEHTSGAKVETDAPNSTLSQLLDTSLTPTLSDDEIARYRALGRDCGHVIDHVARSFPKGRISALSSRYNCMRCPVLTWAASLPGASEAEIAGIDTTVLLVAADHRLENPRAHTAACVAEVAALQTVVGGGKEAGRVFEAMAAAYASGGFEGEWKLHHQGGLTGYKPRYWRAMPGGKELAQVTWEGHTMQRYDILYR